MERSLYLYPKPIFDLKFKEEFREELRATQKEVITEILARLFPNETDLYLTAEYFIQEEDSIEHKEDEENWILLDKQFVYGGEEEDLFQDRKQQEEDLIEKKERLTPFEKFKEELHATQKEVITEILIRLFPNEIDLYSTAEHLIKQPIQEEDSIENKEDKENWILFDKQFVYGGEEEDLFQDRKQQEEDLTEKKERLIHFKKQFNYAFGDQDLFEKKEKLIQFKKQPIYEDLTERQKKWILFDKQLFYGVVDQEKQRQRFEMLLQRQEKKRDLLFGREVLLLRFAWQKKKPRIRLKYGLVQGLRV